MYIAFFFIDHFYIINIPVVIEVKIIYAIIFCIDQFFKLFRR